jgi:hypothetical protein
VIRLSPSFVLCSPMPQTLADIRSIGFCRKLPGRTGDTHGNDGLYPANE